MQHAALMEELETLVQETNELWDSGWVTFNWRGYTYDHVQRVRGLAMNLCRQESGDISAVELAALLHDITKPYDGEYLVDEKGQRIVDERGYWKNQTRPPARANQVTELYDRLGLSGQLHNESGATIAKHLLPALGVNEATGAKVSQTILEHLRPPEGALIESRCLYDADTIDANIGLPAFVRNIYINLHFHDRRKSPETPPIATLLRDTPMGFLRPYVSENLPRWAVGKRRDFTPRLTTQAGVALAQDRLDRLDRTFESMASELDGFAPDGHRRRLSVVLHYMDHRDDPSIAQETDYLARTWSQDGASPEVKEFIAALQREMAGIE